MALTKVKLIADGVIVADNLAANHGITTDNIGEGSALYYTDARVASYLSSNNYATEGFVTTAVSNLVDAAPSTLDTLNELAAALGDDPNFATTVTNSIAGKLPLTGGTLTGTLNGTSAVFSGNINTDVLTASGLGSDRVILTRTGIGTYNLAISGNNRFAVYDAVAEEERFNITSNGNVGIGVNPPLDLLHVDMSKGSGDVFFQNNTSYQEIFYGTAQANASCAAIRWRDTGLSIHSYGQSYGSQLFIDADEAKVGIGITSPDTLFHVNGKTTISSAGGANSPSLAIDNSTSSSFIHSLEAFGVNLQTGQTNLMMIGKEGNTRNSGYLGYYWSSDASTDNFVSIGHWGADHLLRVYGSGQTAIGGDLYMFKSSDPKIFAPAGVGLNIDGQKLYLNRYTSDDIVMTGGGGNVGIGVTEPQRKLHVIDNEPQIRVTYGSASDTRYAELLWGGLVGYATDAQNNALTIGFNGGSSTEGGIYFNAGPTTDYRTRMRLTRDGKLGIGRPDPQDIVNVHDSSASANIGLKITRGTQTHGLRLGVNDAHAFLWTTENQDIAFGTSNQQRLTVKSSGGAIVNATTSFHATSPSHFVVSGNGTTYTAPSSNTDVPVLTVENTNQGTTGNGHAILLLRTNTGGQVSTGATAGDAFISFDAYNTAGWTAGVDFSDGYNFKITTGWSLVDGGIGVELPYNGTAWQANSDERLKENIVNIGTVLDKIDNIRCVKYNFISEEEMPTQYGFIAQDWQENFSEVLSVSKDPKSAIEDKLSMKYTETIPILMKAIQELKAEIDSLKAQLNG